MDLGHQTREESQRTLTRLARRCYAAGRGRHTAPQESVRTVRVSPSREPSVSVCGGPLPTALRLEPALRPAGGRSWDRFAERCTQTGGFRTGRGHEVCEKNHRNPDEGKTVLRAEGWSQDCHEWR